MDKLYFTLLPSELFSILFRYLSSNVFRKLIPILRSQHELLRIFKNDKIWQPIINPSNYLLIGEQMYKVGNIEFAKKLVRLYALDRIKQYGYNYTDEQIENYIDKIIKQWQEEPLDIQPIK